MTGLSAQPDAAVGLYDAYNDERRNKARSEITKKIGMRVSPLREIQTSASMAMSSTQALLKGFNAGDRGVGHKVLGMLISEMNRKNSSRTVGHYTLTSEADDAAILDPVDPKGKGKTNMQRVIHLAQNSALFRPSAEYASTAGDAVTAQYPMTPPATAILYSLMGKAESADLTIAIEGFKQFGKLQLTTRMFLCHTRMPPEHCVVIVAEDGTSQKTFILATCADLLLAEIRAMRDALVYFHSEGSVLIRDMNLHAPVGDEQKVPAALYLLASVGAVLNNEDQKSALSVMKKLDTQKVHGIFSLSYLNADSTTRPSPSNKEIHDYTRNWIAYKATGGWAPAQPHFGQTRRHRYI